MIGEVAGIVTTLKAVKDISESMVGLHNAAAFQEKRFELQAKLLEAQNGAFAANEERAALIEAVRNLEQEVSDLKQWEAEKKRYEMKDIGLGTIAYALKPECQGTEPNHYLCANCFNAGKKHVLQPETRPPRDTQVYICHACDSELITFGGREWQRPEPKKPDRYQRRRW